MKMAGAAEKVSRHRADPALQVFPGMIDDGVPDFTVFSARSFDDRVRLAELLRRTIEAFEPRLIDVQVSLEPYPGNDLSLLGIIEAKLLTDMVPEPVSFETSLDLKEGKIEVHAGTR